jgi:hypothetical protein
MLAAGLLGSLALPSAGEMNGGKLVTLGMGLRAGSAILFLLGVGESVQCFFAENTCGAAARLFGGALGYGTGIIYDIATAATSAEDVLRSAQLVASCTREPGGRVHHDAGGQRHCQARVSLGVELPPRLRSSQWVETCAIPTDHDQLVDLRQITLATAVEVWYRRSNARRTRTTRGRRTARPCRRGEINRRGHKAWPPRCICS